VARRLSQIVGLAILCYLIGAASAHATSISLPLVLDGNWVCASNRMIAGDFFTGGCEQSPGAATLADATTWTWTSASEVAFDITDWSAATDRFEVYDGGSLFASVLSGTEWQFVPGCNGDPGDASCGIRQTFDDSFASPFSAHATLVFAPGFHSIAIRDIEIPVTGVGGVPTNTPFPNGTVAFRASPVPEPATLFLLGAGLLGGAAWSRRRRRSKSQESKILKCRAR
jgi:hypothetical protein